MTTKRLFVSTATFQFREVERIRRHLGLQTCLNICCLNHASEYTRLEASEKAREVENKDKASGGVVQTLDDYVQK